jgi:hypothetical protein
MDPSLFGDIRSNRRRRAVLKVGSVVMVVVAVIALLAGSVLPFLER